MTRRLPFAVFLSLIASALYLTAKPDTVFPIADGVWFREGDLSKGHCNNVIIEMKDYLIVVDANFPSGAELVMAEAKRLSSKPIRYVFDTHHHGDHAYANAVWTKAGATTFAHANVALEMKRREPAGWKAAESRADVKALNLPTAEPPQETFSKSPRIIDDGSRRVEFHHFGWAHTKGDGFAYLPKERILCTGDAATNGAYNFTGHGNIGNWPSVLASVQGKLKFDKVLPGHGPHGGPEIVAGQKRFFEELHEAVAAARKSGKKLEDVVTMKDGNPASTTLTLPDAVKNWVGNPFPAQVRDAWVEQERRTPRGDLDL